jgi:hypothetical protein
MGTILTRCLRLCKQNPGEKTNNLQHRNKAFLKPELGLVGINKKSRQAHKNANHHSQTLMVCPLINEAGMGAATQ